MKVEIRDFYIDALNYSFGTDNKVSEWEVRVLLERLLQEFIEDRFNQGCGDQEKLREAIQKFD